MLGDGVWHPSRGVDLTQLRPEVSRIEPVVCGVCECMGTYAVIVEALPLSVSVRVRQMGRTQQILLHAALARQIGLQWPEGYRVTLADGGTPAAHIRIEPTAYSLATIRGPGS